MEEHEIPGTSVKVVRVAGDEAKGYGAASGKAAATPRHQRYLTMEEKVKNIERYLIWRVDSIRKWVILAVAVSAISSAAVIALLLTVLSAPRESSVAERGKGTAEPEVRVAPPATENRKLSETPAVSGVGEKADGRVAKAARVAPDEGSARDDERQAGAPTDATIDVVPDGKPAATPAGPRKKAESADIGRSADAGPADARKEATLVVERRTRQQQGAAPAVQADSERQARANRAVAKKELPKAEPSGQPLARDASPTAATATTAAPVPSSRAESAARKSAGPFRIGALAIASGMAGLEPQGAADHFSTNQNRLYCWTLIESDSLSRVPKNSRYVVHRWVHNGKTVRERKITVSSPSYRAYSVLHSPGDRPGKWRVDIIDANGQIIATEKFVVD